MKTKIKEQTALEAYEGKQDEIKKLLKQIGAAVEKNDKDRRGMVDWGHVGSLSHAVEELTGVRDWLQGKAK